MGLLDGLKERASNALSQAKSAASSAVDKVEKAAERVEEKAVEVGHAAQSAFDPKPSAPSASSPPSPSKNPLVSARSLATGALAHVLHQSVTANVTAAGKSDAAPADGPAGEAKAMIARHTNLGGLNLKEEALAQEMADLAKRDPAKAAAVLKEVMTQLPEHDRDDVAEEFAARSSDDTLQKLAMIPDGKAALSTMKKELLAGFDTSHEDDMAMRLQTAMGSVAHADADPKLHTPQLELAAAATYEVNGQKKFDLSDPAARRALIANSPQLDNLKGGNDATRCGGASMLNAMILSGNPSANAQAIEKTLAAPEFQAKLDPKPSADEQGALQAMKGGSLTPTQAANLQELLLRMAQMPRDADAKRPNFRRTDGSGLTVPAMADIASELRSRGAFAGARSVAFHANASHWTVAVTDASGATQTANSFPDKTGKGSVSDGPPKKNPNDASYTDLTITNQPDGRAVYSATGKIYVPKLGETVTPVPKQSEPHGTGAAFDWANLVNQFATGGFVESQ